MFFLYHDKVYPENVKQLSGVETMMLQLSCIRNVGQLKENVERSIRC